MGTTARDRTSCSANRGPKLRAARSPCWRHNTKRNPSRAKHYSLNIKQFPPYSTTTSRRRFQLQTFGKRLRSQRHLYSSYFIYSTHFYICLSHQKVQCTRFQICDPMISRSPEDTFAYCLENKVAVQTSPGPNP